MDMGVLFCYSKGHFGDLLLFLNVILNRHVRHLLKHRDSFGKEKKKEKIVLYLIRHYPKYF